MWRVLADMREFQDYGHTCIGKPDKKAFQEEALKRGIAVSGEIQHCGRGVCWMEIIK